MNPETSSHPPDGTAAAPEEINPTATAPEKITPSRPCHQPSPPAWKLLIIDDDVDIHAITKTVLRYITFEGMPLECISGYSGADARRLMREHTDTAIILLDVIMETDRAGLDVVRYVREELNNHLVRIILRTGQSGQAPEKEVVSGYDINDYREKSDLSSRRLVTSIILGLRSYRDLLAVRSRATSTESLEKQLADCTQALLLARRDLQQSLAVRRQQTEHSRHDEQESPPNQDGDDNERATRQ
ncbi:MAG: hypothetical protein HQL64_09530 [Magnetococcales bacterium]|nr:hypothetical protein [Magnetococcales bacterium]